MLTAIVCALFTPFFIILSTVLQPAPPTPMMPILTPSLLMSSSAFASPTTFSNISNPRLVCLYPTNIQAAHPLDKISLHEGNCTVHLIARPNSHDRFK